MPPRSRRTTISPSMDVSRKFFIFSGTLSVQLSDTPSMTVETCIETCVSAGYIRAGLVAGSQCWCGNVIKPGNHVVSNGSCSTACTGNPTEICGGNGDMLEHSIGPPVAPQGVSWFGEWYGTFNGDFICLPDESTRRSLHHFQESSDLMTVELCISTCDAGGFSIAGVEYESECWCGNADMYGRQIIHPSTSVCNFPSPGNPAEICGGANALSEFAFPFRSVSIGPGQPFTFPYNATRVVSWCGNTTTPALSALSTSSSECNMSCTNYADFVCGGANRLSIASRVRF
ncbi:hypothetical protein K443DRAFT_133432 [Laccaria amethystina LaAM-08-1]|uniref:WSC domain-containing protein n=1 Tax=Laccaria amethystina LaAM-08-1 TaxID=1095629 RepID=A0A0C9XLI8_9AGAR|nr:hypothetical protein K443DRAFT_133432 [Laccaria amethystina LaAM-08-1]